MTNQNASPAHSIHASADVSQPAHSNRYRIGTWLIAGTLVALAAAGFKSGPAGSRSSAAPPAAESPYPSIEYSYFPGQYLNQASEPSEHIQAF